jgi:hypothetical protein
MLVDGKPVSAMIENCGEFEKIRHEGIKLGEHVVTLKW